ncbi:nucleotide exchange factor GrpE [Eggerthia catenaformis]|nr:nucleotide exchange factor GrpE [Eggerthia catenaformis]
MAEEKKETVQQEETEITADKDVEVIDAKEDSSLEKRVQELEEEVIKWKTDYYKVFADMENTRKRLNKEHTSQVKYAMQSFIEELLPVIDNFERSLAVETTNEEAANYLKGMQMIHDQMMNILAKNGVKVIETKDQMFDPNFHQAVMTEHDESKEENMILEELQRGYVLKDRVIRASLVKVNQ